MSSARVPVFGLGPDSPLRQVKRRKPRDLEHQEQVALFRWAELNRARVPELGLLFAIPNFSGRLGKAPPVAAIRQAQKLNAEGRKKGVPDVFLPVAREPFHGMFLELKAPGGRPSPEQRAWIDALLEEGYRVHVCVGWEAARDAIVSYLRLTRPLTGTR